MKSEKTMDSVLKFASKVQENRYLDAISKGLMGTLPILMIGSIALLLAILPIDPWTNFLGSIGVTPYLLAASTVTTSCMAIYSAFLMGNRLAKSFDQDGITAGIISIFAFLIVTPLKDGALNMTFMGAQGLFAAIFASLAATRVYCALMKNEKLKIKMPESVPPVIANTFSSIFPCLLTGALMIAVATCFSFTSWGSFADMVYSVVSEPLNSLGSNVWSLVIIVLVQMFLWFFGIHGSLVVGTVISAIYMPMALDNMAALQSGVPMSELPNILGNTFYSMYAGIGGAGGTLSLLIVMLFFAKSKKNKALAKMAIIPGLFTINEPVVFGYPLILNPIMAIPFISVPIIQILVAYFVMAAGIVPPLTGVQVPFGVPVLVGAFIGGSWQAAVLQVVCIAIGVLVWFPFFKMSDRQEYKLEIGEATEE